MCLFAAGSLFSQCQPRRSVAEQVAARFDHVLVDEYQDTN
jgi:superfamily I DNA/RNA helicase